MHESPRAYILKLFGWIALFVLLGAPLVGFLWETLNRLLAGHFDAFRVAISLPVLAMLYVLLLILARFVQRWDSRPTAAPPSPAAGSDAPPVGRSGSEME